MIKIKNISFQNFRQYKNTDIDFETSGQFQLHVLKAKNGTGKTTFLNGILWCLYGKEYYLGDKEKALPRINDSLVEESEKNKTLYATVKLTIADGNKTIIFSRTEGFTVAVDYVRNKKNAISNGTSKLTISVSEPNVNTDIIEDEEITTSIVKQYFDESIFDFYFFDGENLKSYFTAEKSTKIKSSIFNISQVTLLKIARDHLTSMSTEKSREAVKIKDEGSDLYLRISELKEEIQKLNEDIQKINEELPKLNEAIDADDQILHEYKPISTRQEKRLRLELELKGIEKEYKDFLDSKKKFIRDYLILLSFYPRLKSTYKMIKDKKEAGTLPPNIDKEQVRNMLENHVKHCPVCDGIIDEHAINFLTGLLEKLDVSSETSNYLMSLYGSLEDAIIKCEKYQDEKNAIITKESYYKDEIERINNDLNNISKFLANFDSSEKLDVPTIERRRKSNIERSRILTGKLESNKKQIEYDQKELIRLEKEVSLIESRQTTKTTLNKQVSILRSLSSILESIQTSIMNQIKDEIKVETWKCFDSMIWKKNTFGGLDINSEYVLSVMNKNGKEMTGSLSATEYMALAYSFTLAIHKASGRNCPLVVDSPLGRVSDDNRANMARELLKVSMNKQIIMLFTPDEYSDEVRNLYDTNALSIREIILSDDEKSVESVGAK